MTLEEIVRILSEPDEPESVPHRQITSLFELYDDIYKDYHDEKFIEFACKKTGYSRKTYEEIMFEEKYEHKEK